MSCDESLYIHCHGNNNLVIIIMYVAVCIVALLGTAGLHSISLSPVAGPVSGERTRQCGPP